MVGALSATLASRQLHRSAGSGMLAFSTRERVVGSADETYAQTLCGYDVSLEFDDFKPSKIRYKTNVYVKGRLSWQKPDEPQAVTTTCDIELGTRLMQLDDVEFKGGWLTWDDESGCLVCTAAAFQYEFRVHFAHRALCVSSGVKIKWCAVGAVGALVFEVACDVVRGGLAVTQQHHFPLQPPDFDPIECPRLVTSTMRIDGPIQPSGQYTLTPTPHEAGPRAGPRFASVVGGDKSVALKSTPFTHERFLAYSAAAEVASAQAELEANKIDGTYVAYESEREVCDRGNLRVHFKKCY